MRAEWTYIGITLLVSMFLPAVAIFMAGLLAPKKANKIKNSTYECGIETVGSGQFQFKIQYYIFALIFMLFDVEVIFLYPWAVAYNQLPFFAVMEGVVFLALLLGGLWYLWKKDLLEWS